MNKPNELLIPPLASKDKNAKEIVRIWMANGKQHVSLIADAWDDPSAWGLMLVDLAKHVAAAYHHADGRDQNQTLKKIKQGFDAEWNHPTDDPANHKTR